MAELPPVLQAMADGTSVEEPLPAQPCPWCADELCATERDEGGSLPGPGSLLVCSSCAGCVFWQPDDTLRKVTAQELVAFGPEIRAEVKTVQAAICAAVSSGGRPKRGQA